MYCPSCGKELADGSQFCKYCGAKMKQAQVAQPAPIAPKAKKQKGKPKRLFLVLGILALVAVIAVGAVLLFGNKTMGPQTVTINETDDGATTSINTQYQYDKQNKTITVNATGNDWQYQSSNIVRGFMYADSLAEQNVAFIIDDDEVALAFNPLFCSGKYNKLVITAPNYEGATTNTYDFVTNNQKQVTQVTKTTQWTYDGSTSTYTYTKTYTYDQNGNVTAYNTTYRYSDGDTSNYGYTFQYNGKKMTGYSYTYSDGSSVTNKYTFDGNGYITSMDMGEGIFATVTYDDNDHISTVTASYSEDGYTGSYTETYVFDKKGYLISVIEEGQYQGNGESGSYKDEVVYVHDKV